MTFQLLQYKTNIVGVDVVGVGGVKTKTQRRRRNASPSHLSPLCYASPPLAFTCTATCTTKHLACVAGCGRGGKSKLAREGE